MYGGNCTGHFARSVADLNALCIKNGIQLYMHFLYNESLIPRARNYITDEFMRSDCTHMIFIDADIGFDPNDVLALLALSIDNNGNNEYDIIGAAYPKKCLHHSTKVVTEDGKKTIDWVVTNKYTGKVLTVSQKGKFEWNSVITHSKEDNAGKSWVGIQTFDWNNNNKINPANIAILTDDHQVAYVDSPIDYDIKYTEALNLS